MAEPRTHRERAEEAALEVSLCSVMQNYKYIIARTMFPSELIQAAQACERYLVERGINWRGAVGRFQILPALRAALALYPEPGEREPDHE